MSELPHTALLVEDHPETAALLAEWVKSLGHRVRIATTLEEVGQAIAEGGFCYVILDKQIPAMKGSLPLTATGDTAQKRLRAVDPRRNADDHHLLPILVFSGASKEASFIAKNYLLGASIFIPKPADAETMTEAILAALARAHREDHACCAPVSALKVPEATPRTSALVRLALDGIRIGQRTSFLVNGKRADLQAQRFAVVLQVAAERLRGSDSFLSVHVLGIFRTPGLPSRIREDLEAVLPEGFLLLQRGEPGTYRLHPLVVVDPIDWTIFERHANAKIQRIATAELKRR